MSADKRASGELRLLIRIWILVGFALLMGGAIWAAHNYVYLPLKAARDQRLEEEEHQRLKEEDRQRLRPNEEYRWRLKP
jgi:hypothetical protein